MTHTTILSSTKFHLQVGVATDSIEKPCSRDLSTDIRVPGDHTEMGVVIL